MREETPRSDKRSLERTCARALVRLSVSREFLYLRPAGAVRMSAKSVGACARSRLDRKWRETVEREVRKPVLLRTRVIARECAPLLAVHLFPLFGSSAVIEAARITDTPVRSIEIHSRQPSRTPFARNRTYIFNTYPYVKHFPRYGLPYKQRLGYLLYLYSCIFAPTLHRLKYSRYRVRRFRRGGEGVEDISLFRLPHYRHAPEDLYCTYTSRFYQFFIPDVFLPMHSRPYLGPKTPGALYQSY